MYYTAPKSAPPHYDLGRGLDGTGDRRLGRCAALAWRARAPAAEIAPSISIHPASGSRRVDLDELLLGRARNHQDGECLTCPASGEVGKRNPIPRRFCTNMIVTRAARLGIASSQ